MNSTQILQLIVVPMLLSMMITTGLNTTFSEIRSALDNKLRIVESVVVNYVLVPAVTIFLLIVFRADSLVEIGFIILAVCPGAPFAPFLAHASRANVHLATGMMVLLSVSSVLLAPLLLFLIVHEFPDIKHLRINYVSVIKGLFLFQLLPLFTALLVRQKLPALSKKLVQPFALLTKTLVIIMIVYGIYSQWDFIVELSLSAITGMILLFVINLMMGWFAGGKDIASRKATAFVSAIRNTGVGMIIAIDNFGGTITITVVILWGLIMTILGLITVIPFKRMQNKN